jgi:hypothetical protein
VDNVSHIFICYSSKDEATARRVVQFLEAEGLKCWIASRDVPPGQNYQETIVQALERSKSIVFLFSENSAGSGEIKKELSLAGGLNAPVFPLRLSQIAPSGALRYELATRQWIDMFPDADQALRALVATLRGEPVESPQVKAEAPVANIAADPAAPARKRTRKRAPIVAPDSPEFEAIRVMLARHIGPIAKVFVQKAATESRTPDEFIERLSGHLSIPAQRPAFQQAVRAQLGAKS